MASRDFLKHVVSTSEPVGSTLGDQWYNPTTNTLRARLAVNGTSVAWVQTYPPVASTTSSLINFVESNSIVSPNDTTPVAAITAGLSSYANVDVALVTRGTGAITAQIPDSTTSGGNKRGAFAVDFQRTRITASQVAAGQYSFIGSGQNNSSHPTAFNTFIGAGIGNTIYASGGGFNNQFIGSGQNNTINWSSSSFIGAGQSNTITGPYEFNSFIGSGVSNTISGEVSSIIGGGTNSTNGIYSFIGGGNTNVINSAYGVIGGGWTNTNTAAAKLTATISSVATKANCALAADAVITAGMIVKPRTGESSINTNISGITAYSAAGTTYTTNSGSGNGTTYTLLHAGAAVTYAIDTWVTIAGVTLTSGSINGAWLVTGSSAGSVSFANTATGTISVAGTVRQSTQITVTPVAQFSVSAGQISIWKPAITIAGGANNIASGNYSFIGGGGDAVTATNRNTASGDWSAVVGGYINLASGNWSVVTGGRGNTASGAGSFVGGGGTFGSDTRPNIASGDASSILGGLSNQTTGFCASALGMQNLASGALSTAIGYNSTTRGIWGNFALSAQYSIVGFPQGGAQLAFLILGRTTTDATSTILTSDNNGPNPANQLTLPDNSAYYFKGSVIAGVTGAGATKAWTFEGAIKRGVGVATTAIVGAVTKNIIASDAGAATWDVSFTAGTSSGNLAVTVTGQASATIRWVCKLESTEMTF